MKTSKEHLRSWVPSVPLCDIGVNLTHPKFSRYKLDFDNVVLRAESAGVSHMMITGTDIESSRDSLELAYRSPTWFSTTGIHPTRAKSVEPHFEHMEASLRALLEEAGGDKIAAVGECGLDYARLFMSPKAAQKAVFPVHVRLSSDFDLPLFLHSRESRFDFFRIFGRHARPNGETRGVLHCFTGSEEEVKQALDFGLFVSASGISITRARRAIARIPPERLLIETDAPFCSMKKGKRIRNEPAHAVEVLYEMANVYGMSPDVLAEQVWSNTVTLFPRMAAH